MPQLFAAMSFLAPARVFLALNHFTRSILPVKYGLSVKGGLLMAAVVLEGPEPASQTMRWVSPRYARRWFYLAYRSFQRPLLLGLNTWLCSNRSSWEMAGIVDNLTSWIAPRHKMESP